MQANLSLMVDDKIVDAGRMMMVTIIGVQIYKELLIVNSVTIQCLCRVSNILRIIQRDRSFFIPWKMFDRHSEYLEKGTSSLEDISRVVTKVPVKGER